jgi:uncharacterized protein (DUF362 family)/Pyruvate/2-oxoacid:ferredoxin oxidoreductase delta subunit
MAYPPDVLILDSDYRRTDEAVEQILETFPLRWKGKRVLIKPNMLGPYPPEKGITTHPALIRSLVRSLKRRDAVCWVGDNPGLSGYAANERCARVTGLYEAADGGFVYLGREAVSAEAKTPWPEKVVVSRALFDADLIVNVPKFKTHMQTKVTGAVKNLFGLLVGAEKARIHLTVPHPDDFAKALVGIYRIRVPDLTVMDAVVGMEGNGPSGKDLRRIGKILAAPNGVCVDGVMAAMMGVAPLKIATLRAAREAGLGEIDPEKMRVEGGWAPLKKFKMPWTFASEGRIGKALNRLIYRPLLKPRLRIRKDLCTRCEVCIRHCPARAMTLDVFPRLDAKKCIACYCCYELCSSQAIELTGLMRRVSGKRQNVCGA